MGFWSTVGKVGKAVGEEALKQGGDAMDRSKQYKEEMPDKSDSDLISFIKGRSHSPMKAGAASIELKNRGYSQEEIKEMM